MAIDSHYIPAFSIEDVLLDKDTGAPLSGGLVYFEQDNQRGVLKPVYQITGTSPNYTFIQLPNPMTLSSIGTFEDSLSNPVIPYFYPYDAEGEVELYYVRVTDAGDVPQFAREAVPYIGDSSSSEITSAFENELSNPQFAEVVFDTNTPTYTYSFNAAAQEVVALAPGWDLVVTCSGVGTVTVAQLTPVGSLNRLTNPGTILNITSGGVSRLRLRQRLYGSPNLWGSGYLSGAFIAKTYSGTDTALTLYYSQSNGIVVDEPIVQATINGNGLYAVYSGNILIPASASTDSSPDAYVDIEFDLPVSTQIDISSVMIAATGLVPVSNIAYDQTTLDRQISELFYYYKPQLDFKAIPSLLTGWDFPLNPAQILGTSFNITTTAKYGWDQTIVKSVVGNIAVVRNAVTGGFQATTGNANEAYYQIQYLSGSQAKKMLGTKLSVNIDAFRTQAGGAVTVKVYLYSGRAAATIPALPTSIGTIVANGDFTLTAANWTLIPRTNFGQATETLSIVNTAAYATLNDKEDLQFSGWEITDATQIADTDKFAIVVTYSCPTSGTVVVTNSISVVPGDIPTRPAPQTPDQVLQECRYYYETSYPLGVQPGSSESNNALTFFQIAEISGGICRVYSTNLSFPLKEIKRTAPGVTFYTPAGTLSNLSAKAYSDAGASSLTDALLTNWAPVAGTNSVSLAASTNAVLASTAGASVARGAVFFHYEANAQLGVV